MKKIIIVLILSIVRFIETSESSHFSVNIVENEKIFDVDFKASMVTQNKHKFIKRNTHFINFCHLLYNANKISVIKPNKEPIIPKILHIIWLGHNNPPPIYNECIASIKKFFPEWQLNIWTDKEVSQLNLINQKYYDSEINYAAKSDILRYELLYQYGGVYLDIDMICQKNFDILIHRYEFFAGFEPYGRVLGNAIIGSITKHPILEECIKNIALHTNKKDVVKRTGPFVFQKSFQNATKRRKQRVIAFPSTFFYPLDWSKKMVIMSDGVKNSKPETFAIHYWAGTWL